MTWFLLILAFFMSIRLYAKWLGYFHVFQHGTKTPFNATRDWDARPKVTFMIPSFNESKIVCEGIESILSSDWPREKIEIIAVDDCSSDDTYSWLQKMHSQFPDNVITWKNEVNLGKSHTLMDIARRSTGDIVFTVDSDTIIAPNTIKEIVSCYADPEMGGVCGFVLCKNLNDSIWTQMQGMLFFMFYIVSKVFENQFKSARVLSGQIASFRRDLFIECIPILQQREVLGVKNMRSGEDTYLTTIISMGLGLKKKWKVFSNFEARAWTNNPANMMGYLRQQLRWWRSNECGAQVLVKLYPTLVKVGFIPVLISTIGFIGGVTMMVMLVYFAVSGILLQAFVNVLLEVSFTSFIACLVYNHMIGRHDKVAGKIKNPLFAGIWFGIWVLVSWVSLVFISFFTFDDGGWVTRQAGQSNTGKK